MTNHKDFRVGNLVRYEGKIYKIYSIAEEFPTLDTIKFGIGVVTWSDIKPIELNERILKKFGLEKGEKLNPYYYHFGGNGYKEFRIQYSNYIKNNVEGERIVTEGKWQGLYLSGRYWRRVKYLHELQNIFHSITGEELESQKQRKGK